MYRVTYFGKREVQEAGGAVDQHTEEVTDHFEYMCLLQAHASLVQGDEIHDMHAHIQCGTLALSKTRLWQKPPLWAGLHSASTEVNGFNSKIHPISQT